jgi:hypothetical protein
MAQHVHSDAAGHRSADDQYLETPTGAAYEHTDAAVPIIVKFIVWLGVSAVIIHVGLWLLFDAFAARRIERAEPRFPLAAHEGPRLPPEPRLQQFPREDIMNFRLREEGALDQYGWVDKDAGVVRVPIQDAMRLVLERRLLRSRPQQPSEDPALVPADSNAGRTMEKRP